MIKALYTSATGMIAHSTVVDTTANNLANVDTTGFKRSQVEFQDLLYQNVRVPGTQGATGYEVPTGIQIGSGVRTSGISKIFSQGNFENTSNDLDIAIEGQGFFQILMPNGEFRYTRDGSFRLNSTGQLVTADGFLLQPPIAFPNDTLSITVGTDGTVSVITAARRVHRRRSETSPRRDSLIRADCVPKVAINSVKRLHQVRHFKGPPVRTGSARYSKAFWNARTFKS